MSVPSEQPRLIRAPRDFAAGLVFFAFGAAVFALSLRYPMGTLLAMGPGLYPAMLAVLSMFIGIPLLVQSFIRSGPPIPRLHLATLAIVVLPVAAFGWGAQTAGLVITAALFVAVVRLASPDKRWVEIVVLSLFLAAFIAIVFVVGLRLPFNLWPGAD